MASVKVTYSLDPETVARLERAAERLGVSKSQVVREAIFDYSTRIDRLSERERLRLLSLRTRGRRDPESASTTSTRVAPNRSWARL